MLTVLRKARRGWAWTGHPLPPSVPLGRWVLVKRMEPGLGRKEAREGLGGISLVPPKCQRCSQVLHPARAWLDLGQGRCGAGTVRLQAVKPKCFGGTQDPACSPPPAEDGVFTEALQFGVGGRSPRVRLLPKKNPFLPPPGPDHGL